MEEDIYPYFALKRLDDLKNLNPKPESKEFQRKIVKSILQRDKFIFDSMENGKGKIYCVIDSTWFNQWKKYVEFDQHPDEIIPLEKKPKRHYIESTGEVENEGELDDELDIPGKIDNIRLVDDPSIFLASVSKGFILSDSFYVFYKYPVETLELKKDLKKGVDFEIIPSEAWEFLLTWYGGYHEGFGPCIPRFGINNSEIDLFPLIIPCSVRMKASDIVYHSKEVFSLKSIRFCRRTSLKDILSVLKWKYKNYTNYFPFQRLWICYLESPWKIIYSSFGDKITPGFNFENLIPYFETGKYQIVVEVRKANQKFDLRENEKCKFSDYYRKEFKDDENTFEEGEDIGVPRIVGIIRSNFFISLFHCLSNTECLIKYFTKNENFLEEMRKYFENKNKNKYMGYNSWAPSREFDKIFGSALVMMWIRKRRFLDLSDLKTSINIANYSYRGYGLNSPLNLYHDFIKLLERDMDNSRHGDNFDLIKKNFSFIIHHLIPEQNNISETLSYFPVIYNKPITSVPIQVHSEYCLEEMIQDKLSVMNIEIVSFPNVLVIGEESYRDRFKTQQNPPLIINGIQKRVKTPLILKPCVFGEKHRKTAQFYYELYGVIYYKDKNEFNKFGYHLCRVKVPNVDLTYLSGEKTYSWYSCNDSKIRKVSNTNNQYFSITWSYSGGKMIHAVPVMWFYERKRDLNWDDPELFKGRVSYLMKQCCCVDSEIGCNLKLSFSGFHDEDIFVPFVFVFIG